jgi:hypothetical protein
VDHYFAVIDDSHDVTNPLTVVRVVAGTGPYWVTRLNDEVVYGLEVLISRSCSTESGSV